MLEKLCVFRFGRILSCFVVRLASSSANISPTIVISRAISFISGGMVMIIFLL